MAGCCLNHFQFGNPIWIPVNGPDVLNQEFGRIYLKRRSVSLIAFSQSTTYPIQCFEFVKVRKRLRCTISGCGFNHQGLNLLLIRTAAAVSVQEVRDGSSPINPFRSWPTLLPPRWGAACGGPFLGQYPWWETELVAFAAVRARPQPTASYQGSGHWETNLFFGV